MRFLLAPVFALIFCIGSTAQLINGRVLDSESGEALEYVSLGVPKTRMGTISDEEGNFCLDLSKLSPEHELRISMIGYEAQSFRIGDLSRETQIFKLIRSPIPLKEVRVKPKNEPGTLGSKSFSRLGGWCGWGGSRFGKGHEIGTMLDLGSEPVLLKSLFVHVHRQAFDTSFFRLHIRTLDDGLPARELLTDNVILSIHDESGWVELDVSNYHIILDGELAFSLEWLKVRGKNEDRAMKINKEITGEYVLFNTRKKQGSTFTRWGVEADWNKHNEGSPSMYLSILR